MEPVGGITQRLAQAAAMASAITVGVTALLLFPRPHPVAPSVRVVAAAPALAAQPLTPSPPPAPQLRPRIAPDLPKPHVAVPVREVRPHAPAHLPVVVAAARRPTQSCPLTASEADRLVCRDPALAAQDRRMRTAYERALAAGADRLEIDRGQARWHTARDRATQPRQLSQLYAQRIGELETAARHPRPPPR